MRNNQALNDNSILSNQYLLNGKQANQSSFEYHLRPVINQVKNMTAAKTKIGNTNNQERKVALPTSEGLDFVKVSDIIRCEGSNKYTKVFIKNQAVLLCCYNIGKFIALLNAYGFYNTHKSHLINLSYIKKYFKEGTLMLDDESIVPVSVRRRTDFLDCLQRL